MKPAFQVGDRVSFPFGAERAEGTVIEVRGLMGVGGRRLYQVEVPNDPFDPQTYELAEDEMEPSRANGERIPLSTAAIIDYLRYGGLTSILQSNLDGGRNQPRVWLCRDSLGGVTHTFYEQRGLVGGETVPFWALYEDRVFTPKREEVLKYLRSFGLSKAQAEEVLAEVGTAP